ncbi:MAG TPA: T9SS type A sorting domain-containing protein, partial [Adhaeribacter sp.]|nr:T9SS type A sorting domain-containing protein [Adhaeribacter sp.]
GDTIIYGLEEQQLYKGYGHPNSPWCQSPTATTLGNRQTYFWKVHAGTEPITNALSDGFHPAQGNDGRVLTGIYRNAQFNQREQLAAIGLSYDGCSQTFNPLMHGGGYYRYAVGLGMVYTGGSPNGIGSSTELLAYKKGTETYGTWQTLAQIMSSKKALEPAAINIYPNPFTSEVSLQFTRSFSSGKASVLVSNVLGQEVLKQEITVLPGQENRLDLGKLPKGIYMLKAEQNGKSFTTRLVKE